MTDRMMQEKIKANILEVDPNVEVWLYGSRARGTAREESDWDILVLSPRDTITNQEESRFIDHMCDLIVETGTYVQVIAYGKRDWEHRHSVTSFYQNIQRDAKRL